MRVADAMTKEPFVVDPTTPLAECRQLLADCRIRHLPVVEDGHLRGLVHATRAFGPHEPGATAADVAAGVHVRARPDEALYDVLGRCAASLEDVCVVVDETDRVLGILTDRDIVRLAADLLDEAVLVDAIASTTLRTLGPQQTIAEALEDMHRAMARHVLVTDEEALAGLLTKLDLVAAPDPEAPLGAQLDSDGPEVVSWGTPVAEAARRMGQRGLDAVVVVADADGPGSRVAEGLVTVTDLLRALRLAPALIATARRP